MTYWIEPFRTDGSYLLGSDSCIRLDGRYGLERAEDEGRAYVHQLSPVHKDLAGFKISRGERCTSLFPMRVIHMK